MKPVKSKADIRRELEDEIKNFVSEGGKVKRIEKGRSGLDDPSKSLTAYTSFGVRQSRTPVSSVVKEIEARKKQKLKPKRVQRRPKRKLIKDDFGEPVRWVWEE